jgi:hypothetical protein
MWVKIFESSSLLKTCQGKSYLFREGTGEYFMSREQCRTGMSDIWAKVRILFGKASGIHLPKQAFHRTSLTKSGFYG